MTVGVSALPAVLPVAVLVVITVSFYIIGNAFADAGTRRTTSDKEITMEDKKLFSPFRI